MGQRGVAYFVGALVLAVVTAWGVPAWGQLGSTPDFSQSLETVDGRRIALVIGNRQYEDAGWQLLPNAVNDAKHIAAILSDPSRGAARFEVDLVEDGSKTEIEAKLRAFAGKASDAAVAVVYYAGHGFQVNGESYLVPRDAPKIYEEGTAALNFISMGSVTASARATGLNIFFLDACRTDAPMIKRRDPTRGLERSSPFGEVSAPESVIFYATSIGEVAYDAAPPGSSLSPFAAAVGAGMQTPGQDLPMIFGKVARHVRQVTQTLGQAQIPVSNANWTMSFYFVPPLSQEALQQESARARPRLTVTPRLKLPPEIVATRDGPTLISLLLDSHRPADILAMAEEGDPLAQYAIGTMYSMGAGIGQDKAAAIQWLERSATSGAPIGQAALAYELMSRPNPDLRRVENLLRSASKAGLSKAKSFLAGNLLSGRFGEARPEEALALWRAAAREGHAYAAYALVLQNERDTNLAALAEMSRQGNAEADNFLCELIHTSEGAEHCLTAAKAGHANARARLALRFRNGLGVEKSVERARYWAGLAVQMPSLNAELRNQIEPLIT